MPTAEHYEVLVLGSGEAGKYLAWTLSSEGQRTALVERSMVGGSCPSVACLPSKNLIHSAKVASLARRGAEFGLSPSVASVDMAGAQRRRRKMVDDLVDVHRRRFAENHVDLIMGEAHFIAPGRVSVTSAGSTPQALGRPGDRQRRHPRVGPRGARPG